MKMPTFIYDYPAKLAALAKIKDDNPPSAKDLSSTLVAWK